MPTTAYNSMTVDHAALLNSENRNCYKVLLIYDLITINIVSIDLEAMRNLSYPPSPPSQSLPESEIIKKLTALSRLKNM